MTTALVRWCDTPKQVMRRSGLSLIQPLNMAIDWAKPGAECTVVMYQGARVPILFTDGVHCDSDALDALFDGRWYYDVKRDKLQRWTSQRVFINGPHLISRPLTHEQRKRIYTDRPAPFVMNAYPLQVEE